MKKVRNYSLWLMSGLLLGTTFLVGGEMNSITNIPLSVKIPSPPATFYLTDDGSNIFGGGPGRVELRTTDFLQMIQSSESWAAEQDPEGNWSSVISGFQISLRFSQKTFTNQQDVVATVLIRNISDKELGFPDTRWGTYGGWGGNFEFDVIRPDGKLMTGKARKASMVSGYLQIFKGTQRKMQFQLTNEFSFELPGFYRIKSRTLVQAPGERYKTVPLETKETTIELK